MESLTCEIANHANTDALFVVGHTSVSTRQVPTSTLVDVAVLTDDEVVADIVPVPHVHMIVLIGAHDP